MAILTLQKRVAERGRIRFGEKKTNAKGVEYPSALDMPRVTSADQGAIAAIAAQYGGEVRPWDSPSGQQWQVTVESDLRVGLLPMNQLYSQHFEHWTKGGCDRRCDGEKTDTGQLCVCEAKGLTGAARCKPTTRASVVILGIGGFGTWRIETGSYYAAVEMGMLLDIAQRAIESGHHITGTLAIEHRRVVRQKEDGSGVETRQFIVPTIRPDLDLEMIATGEVSIIGPGTQPRLSPADRVPSAQPALPAETGGIRGTTDEPELPPPPPLPADGGEVVEPRDERPITDAQRKRLFAIAGKAKVPQEVVSRIARYKSGGARGVGEMQRADYEVVVESVEVYGAHPDVAEERLSAWEKSQETAESDEAIADAIWEDTRRDPDDEPPLPPPIEGQETLA